MKDSGGTIFIDIDGTLIRHYGEGMTGQLINPPMLLEGVLEKFYEWDNRGFKIILTSGRRESSRQQTEDDLKRLGLFWDTLILGLPRGKRVLINDAKTDGAGTTIGITVIRNKGIADVDI